MPDLTVSADVHSMLGAANNAAIRTAIGLGSGDIPTHKGIRIDGGSIGGHQWIRFDTGSTLDADFGVACGQFPNAGNTGSWPGETRYDVAWISGYNIGPTGSKLVPGDHVFSENIESRYKTDAGTVQLEHYYAYSSADDLTSYRPFSMTINLVSHACEVATRAGLSVWGWIDGTNDWLKANSTSSAGVLLFYNSSTINYLGSSIDFIQHAGNSILGVSGTTCRVAAGYADVQFSAFVNPTGATVTLRVGETANSRGLRWNHTTARWEYQASASVWMPFNALTDALTYTKVTGTLGNTVGDYVHLGSVSQVGTYTNLTQLDLVAQGGNGVAGRYLIPRVYADVVNALWYEVQPLAGGNSEGFAVEVRPKFTGDTMAVRVRRKTAGSGSVAFVAVVGLSAQSTESWTTAVSTGAAATVAGYYRNSMAQPLALGAQTVGTSQATIAHGLGYAPTQVLITMTGAGNIYRSATSDATNIYLTADAAARTAEIFVK